MKRRKRTLGLSPISQLHSPSDFQSLALLPWWQEVWVQSLVWEDPLEKEMATDSSILAWKIP